MSTEPTRALIQRRLEAIRAGDIDGIMEGYNEATTLYTPFGPIKGLEAIRALFEQAFATIFSAFESFDVTRQDHDGEVVFLAWRAETPTMSIPLGTDTFIIRDGKILMQSMASHNVPKG